MHHLSSRREDADHFRSMGLDIVDDNELVPENIPQIEQCAACNATLTANINGLKND